MKLYTLPERGVVVGGEEGMTGGGGTSMMALSTCKIPSYTEAITRE